MRRYPRPEGWTYGNQRQGHTPESGATASKDPQLRQHVDPNGRYTNEKLIEGGFLVHEEVEGDNEDLSRYLDIGVQSSRIDVVQRRRGLGIDDWC